MSSCVFTRSGTLTNNKYTSCDLILIPDSSSRTHQARVQVYHAQVGILLEAAEIHKNLGLWTLAKMMLNSMWS